MRRQQAASFFFFSPVQHSSAQPETFGRKNLGRADHYVPVKAIFVATSSLRTLFTMCGQSNVLERCIPDMDLCFFKKGCPS